MRFSEPVLRYPRLPALVRCRNDRVPPSLWNPAAVFHDAAMRAPFQADVVGEDFGARPFGDQFAYRFHVENDTPVAIRGQHPCIAFFA